MSRSSVSSGVAWRPLLWSLLLVAHVAWCGGVRAEPASEATVAFALPAQPLAEALAAFSAKTGYSVLVASDLAADRRAAAVVGEFVPREALQRLLAGSGLAARYSGGNAFTLVSASTPAGDDGAAPGEALADAPFGAALQVSITRALCRAQPGAFGRYRVGVQLWIDEEGWVSAVRLLGTSGDERRDAELEAVLQRLILDVPPPVALAQPITILLTPRPDPAGDCRRLDAGAG